MSRATVNQLGRLPVYDWLKTGLERLFPPVCRLCADAGQPGRDLCAPCQDELPWLEHYCTRCAEPLPEAAEEATCGRCRRRSLPFDTVLAPFRYQAPLDSLIKSFKFQGSLASGRLLADLLAEHARRQPRPQLLIPVPLHGRRLRQRGYNQAVELARQVGRELDIPCSPALALRRRHTPPQHDLPARERRRNIRGAFCLRGPLEARHVAIVDDVLTTGSTVAELARELRHAGARRVDVWVVARAPRPA